MLLHLSNRTREQSLAALKLTTLFGGAAKAAGLSELAPERRQALREAMKAILDLGSEFQMNGIRGIHLERLLAEHPVLTQLLAEHPAASQ